MITKCSFLRVPNTFFCGTWNLPCLKAGSQEFKGKWGRDLGLKVQYIIIIIIIIIIVI